MDRLGDVGKKRKTNFLSRKYSIGGMLVLKRWQQSCHFWCKLTFILQYHNADITRFINIDQSIILHQQKIKFLSDLYMGKSGNFGHQVNSDSDLVCLIFL